MASWIPTRIDPEKATKTSFQIAESDNWTLSTTTRVRNEPGADDGAVLTEEERSRKMQVRPTSRKSRPQAPAVIDTVIDLTNIPSRSSEDEADRDIQHPETRDYAQGEDTAIGNGDEEVERGIRPDGAVEDYADELYDAMRKRSGTRFEDAVSGQLRKGGSNDAGDELGERIRAAISYTRSQAKKRETPRVYSNFNVPVTDPPSDALTLLRNTESEGFATFIFGTPIKECYSLGVPPTPKPFNTIDQQWWIGLSRAEVRAGPLRTETDVKEAKREVSREMDRRKKSETALNGHLRKEEVHAGESWRRQELGLPMTGQLDQKMVRKAMSEHGWDYDSGNPGGTNGDDVNIGPEDGSEATTGRTEDGKSISRVNRGCKTPALPDAEPHCADHGKEPMAKAACQRCKKHKKGCDRERPCERCRDAGIGIEGCISDDEVRRKAGRPKKADSMAVRTDTGAGPGEVSRERSST